MLKAIFATIIIGIASGAGAVQLTIAEKLEDIMNSKESIRQAIEAHGVQVPSDTPLSQYSAKIGLITSDAGVFSGATWCATLGSVNPAGGTFYSVHPFDSVMTCRYTAPAKSITGCASVQASNVAYNGSSWPATTYTVSADAGYYIQNNNTATATCTQCAAGTSGAGGTATSCATCPKDNYCPAGSAAPIACSTVETGFETDSSGATSSVDCHAAIVLVDGITISGGLTSIGTGATTTWTANITPSDAANKSVAWSSSNQAVATVNSGGVVTGVAVGTATITATANDGSGVAATRNITVSVLVSSVSISGGTTNIFIGSSTTWNASVSPNNATNKNLVWSVYSGSSNASITSQSNTSATIRADAYGNATIHATSQDGSTEYGSRTLYICKTGNPINSALSSVCNDNFICNGCPSDAQGWSGQTGTWQVSSCAAPSPDTMYGKSLCSVSNSTNQTPSTSTSGNTGYCWCQGCTNNGRSSCGAWAFRVNYGTAAACASNCANACAYYAAVANYVDFRAALCAP